MFEIKFGETGEVVVAGRFDASQEERASQFFDALTGPQVVDMARLDYISSLGLGILLKTQKRLVGVGGRGLKLVNLNPHVLDVFRYSGLKQIFDIND